MMVSTFSPEMQKTTYEQIKAQLGEYENAEYIKAWTIPSSPDYKILRYNDDFTKSNSRIEVKVVLDKSNKIAAFFVISWSDVLM